MNENRGWVSQVIQSQYFDIIGGSWQAVMIATIAPVLTGAAGHIDGTTWQEMIVNFFVQTLGQSHAADAAAAGAVPRIVMPAKPEPLGVSGNSGGSIEEKKP